jgi:hypothetical protein
VCGLSGRATGWCRARWTLVAFGVYVGQLRWVREHVSHPSLPVRPMHRWRSGGWPRRRTSPYVLSPTLRADRPHPISVAHFGTKSTVVLGPLPLGSRADSGIRFRLSTCRPTGATRHLFDDEYTTHSAINIAQQSPSENSRLQSGRESSHRQRPPLPAASVAVRSACQGSNRDVSCVVGPVEPTARSAASSAPYGSTGSVTALWCVARAPVILLSQPDTAGQTPYLSIICL